jgi:protein-L-isoaspartate(D-aspartate) O-methyltransferase
MDERRRMVSEIEERYGLDSPEVFSAMLQVSRDKFTPRRYRYLAYKDGPVPIGYGQTLSQPYTVAFMTHLLLSSRSNLNSRKKGKKLVIDFKNWKVLEVGTGSGYQAAVLSHLVNKVYTVEIIRQLAEKTEKRLKELGYKNVEVKAGSGEWGWPEKAPFDAIMVTAAVESEVPRALFEQLKKGGVLVVPIGRGHDKVMTKFTKGKAGELKKEKHGIFYFVPFIKDSN